MNTFRNMKRLAITAGLLAMCSAPAIVSAQESSPSQTPQADPGQQAAGPQHGPRHQDELANLNLTDDQKTQVQKIRQDTKSQSEAVKGDTTLTPDQQHAKMQEIHKASHEQILALLTPEQRKQMKSDEMARKAAKQQGSQAPPPQQ
jgi:Spy/CpxP family protein refolding chaperone